jgi:hypothetical protein
MTMVSQHSRPVTSCRPRPRSIQRAVEAMKPGQVSAFAGMADVDGFKAKRGVTP